MGGDVSDGFGVLFIELLNEFFHMYIVCWFPTVMYFREAFPPDQVLDLTPVSPDT